MRPSVTAHHENGAHHAHRHSHRPHPGPRRSRGTFTQALINRPGGTIRIGQPTQGVFSDVMERNLPNGTTAFLPNEEFLNRSGHTYDGTGAPPHLTEPAFTKEEFAKKRDSAFDRAVSALRNDG